MRNLLAPLFVLLLAACDPISTNAPLITVPGNSTASTIVAGVQQACGVKANVNDVVKALAQGVPYGGTINGAVDLICQAFNSVAVRGRRARNATVTVVIHGRRIRGRFVR